MITSKVFSFRKKNLAGAAIPITPITQLTVTTLKPVRTSAGKMSYFVRLQGDNQQEDRGLPEDVVSSEGKAPFVEVNQDQVKKFLELVIAM